MSDEIAQRAFQTALAMDHERTLSAIQGRVRAFAAPFGFNRFVLFSASAAAEAGIEHIYWVEGDWFGEGEAVDALTYVRHCPVTRHMLRAAEPFFWTKTRAQQGERYRIVRTPRGAGLHGVQIPVFGPAGLEGAVSLGGERIDASPPVRLALSLVGTAAFLAARRLFEPAAGEGEGRLSAREREVLSWTAIGRRQADIAAMLGLSERTVENHLRRIRQRLGAATTAQAISVAIRLGEIAPESR
ncbi:PA1136 family autoinducer-binding transcriptional regulator [Serratia nematodiphila]|uniref:LuxR family transcriptional regulatory, chaperone HchA-associated n=1 Tax=Serratia nematodiphila TaxID=458197 RepID=A0A1G5GK91_9GAMM|nr:MULTISPECIES: PA1136 family autoinducer-binding transcriptional regulator [Serratia]ANM78627.1 autoinducer binding domain protein [Serratia marcescens]KFF88961.1 LuxR family transcriptional regulator [Serratia nematodiphila DZ0503SBS1]MDV5744466.1 LuxR C-terminal-related transcriptional regulator [Serratia marcescens]MDV5749377.1 LuxR C-terminal-related transcriptional regulator [Serratia marcescens]MDV5780815.1 LuxR C-terminal-related transcriptional regulator [Serratia marcescens]